MIQAPASTDIVDTIVASIVAKVSPRRVFLFGSRARGDHSPHSDYDFMVEVDGGDEELAAADEELFVAFHDNDCRVDVHLRRAGEIERRKDDPGTTDWDVVREGRLVFARPGLADSVVVRPGRVRERPSGPPDSVHEWMRIALRDLYHARHHLDDDLEDWSDEVCFQSQQSAEKGLKSLIVSRHVRPAHTHDLEKLLAHARSLGLELAGLDSDCLVLKGYAVEPRYPGPGRSRVQARAAVAAAERVIAAVRAHLPAP